jgi:hypothetical protein
MNSPILNYLYTSEKQFGIQVDAYGPYNYFIPSVHSSSLSVNRSYCAIYMPQKKRIRAKVDLLYALY